MDMDEEPYWDRGEVVDLDQGASGGEAPKGWSAPPRAVPVTQAEAEEIARRSLTELQPGQRGAYFERRTKRVWWAPWRRKQVWQQISAWQNTTPPRGAGVDVVTVGDVSELPGKVHTIGTVSQTGAVEW
jgi:hypothetical protein